MLQHKLYLEFTMSKLLNSSNFTHMIDFRQILERNNTFKIEK